MVFLYLNEDQMIEAGVTHMEKCMHSMEEVFRLLKAGDYRMGGANNSSHGLRVMFPQTSDIADMPLSAPGRWFTTMPAYLGGKYHVFGIKSYGANQKNSEKNLPRSILMMSLMDVETGAPLAYMSANILSAMRTGAVSGLAAKYLSRKNPEKIAIVGPGIMARYSLDAIMIACPSLKKISILGRGRKNIEKFKEHCDSKKYSFDEYSICSCMEEACKDADIILTANSQAEKFEDYPYIPARFIKKGATIIITSALRVENTFVNNDEMTVCVADDSRQYKEERSIDAKPDCESESITFKNALHNRCIQGQSVLNFYDIVVDEDFVRDESKVYFFASGGIPIEDVAWGYECYASALEKGIGTLLNLWGESTKL